MVGGAAVFAVVLVVGGEMGIDAVDLEDFGHGVVEWFERAPASVQKVVAAGVELATGRHARHAGDVGVVVGDRAPCEAFEVGRMNPVAAIGRQHASIERVEHHHDGFHWKRPDLCMGAD